MAIVGLLGDKRKVAAWAWSTALLLWAMIPLGLWNFGPKYVVAWLALGPLRVLILRIAKSLGLKEPKGIGRRIMLDLSPEVRSDRSLVGMIQILVLSNVVVGASWIGNALGLFYVFGFLWVGVAILFLTVVGFIARFTSASRKSAGPSWAAADEYLSKFESTDSEGTYLVIADFEECGRIRLMRQAQDIGMELAFPSNLMNEARTIAESAGGRFVDSFQAQENRSYLSYSFQNGARLREVAEAIGKLLGLVDRKILDVDYFDAVNPQECSSFG